MCEYMHTLNHQEWAMPSIGSSGSRWRLIGVLLVLVLTTAGCQAIVPPAASTEVLPRASVLPLATEAPLPSTQPASDATIKAEATMLAYFQQTAAITLRTAGQTFTYHATQRFMVFLDDTRYPLHELACLPEGPISYISNGSIRGPDNYPIMFEAGAPGTCILQNRDFQVTIIVVP
jgi:hypothetical protein